MTQIILSVLHNAFVGVGLLGIRETSFSGRKTRNERNMRRSTSTFDSAKIVMELERVVYVVAFLLRQNCTKKTMENYA